MLSTADAFLSVDPVQRKFWGLGISKTESQAKNIFAFGETDEPIRHSVAYGGHRQFQAKSQNAAVAMGDFYEGTDKAWNFVTYAGGYTLSDELIKYSQLRQIKGAAEMLGRAAKTTVEYLCADFLDNAFNSARPATWDNVEACGTHLLTDGITTVSNKMAVAMPLSQEAMEAIRTALRQMKGEDNMLAPVMMDKLVVPSGLVNMAEKIADTKMQVGTANNDKNVMSGKFEVQPFDYLTSQFRYFVTTKNLPSPADGLFFDFLEKPTFLTDAVVRNLQKDYISYFRCILGLEDWRGIYGVAATS